MQILRKMRPNQLVQLIQFLKIWSDYASLSFRCEGTTCVA